MWVCTYVGNSVTPPTTADVDMFFPHTNVPLFLKPPVGKTDGLAYNPSAQISHSQDPVQNPFNYVKLFLY